MAWTAHKAYALRDINAENFRIFQNYLEWGKSRSLDEFVAIQKRLAAMPWVNTLAVDSPRRTGLVCRYRRGTERSG